jgi:hypothetical protein
MPKKTDTPEDREAQLKVFQDAARELECDDDPERFDERVRRLATAKPSASSSEAAARAEVSEKE